MVMGGEAETTQGDAGNGAAHQGPDQGADAVTVGSGPPVATARTRLRDAVEGSFEREYGPRAGRGRLRGKATRYRKLERVPGDPSTATVTDGCDASVVLITSPTRSGEN